MCNDNQVEDELHFIFNCTYYKEIRYNFLKDVPSCCNSHSLAEFLTNLCKFHPRKLSKFITVIWNKRKEALHEITH